MVQSRWFELQSPPIYFDDHVTIPVIILPPLADMLADELSSMPEEEFDRKPFSEELETAGCFWFACGLARRNSEGEEIAFNVILYPFEHPRASWAIISYVSPNAATGFFLAHYITCHPQGEKIWYAWMMANL